MTERRKFKRTEYTVTKTSVKKKVLTPMNEAQEEYIRLIAENQVVVAIGPAGSFGHAIDMA